MASKNVNQIWSANTMFQPSASPPKNAISLIFDLEGFSRFFNQPDVSGYLPAFLNHVFSTVFTCVSGGNFYWAAMQNNKGALALRLAHVKFMGDGALMILLPPEGAATFDSETVRTLCNRLWNIKTFFSKVIAKCADEVPVFDLPKRIRFGIARGTVIELTRKDDGHMEYVGFCINLASRLQNYCEDLGFVGSARLGIPEAQLKQSGYMKVIATNIKGFPKEIVIVDKNEFEKLAPEISKSLFEVLPG